MRVSAQPLLSSSKIFRFRRLVKVSFMFDPPYMQQYIDESIRKYINKYLCHNPKHLFLFVWQNTDEFSDRQKNFYFVKTFWFLINSFRDKLHQLTYNIWFYLFHSCSPGGGGYWIKCPPSLLRSCFVQNRHACATNGPHPRCTTRRIFCTFTPVTELGISTARARPSAPPLCMCSNFSLARHR